MNLCLRAGLEWVPGLRVQANLYQEKFSTNFKISLDNFLTAGRNFFVAEPVYLPFLL